MVGCPTCRLASALILLHTTPLSRRRPHYGVEFVTYHHGVSEPVADHVPKPEPLAVDSDLKRIAGMPNIGAKRQSNNPKLTDVRSLPVSGFHNYLIFYTATATAVQVMRVIHGARDIDTAFDE